MLRQLKLQSELKQRKAEFASYRDKQVEFEKRQADLTEALEQAETKEDMELVQGNIEELEKDSNEAGLDEKMNNLQGEIERIEGELADIEERGKDVTNKLNQNTEEKRGTNMNRLQVRELLKSGEYYERSEVKSFYEQFKNLRAVGGEGLTIPLVVVNRIMDIVGDYTTLYPLVDKIKVSGTTRILIDTDTSAATWIEQAGTIPTGDVGTITNIDFDGFKVGKVTFVDNCMLQDSIINLDEYVAKKIARAIALALDLAILKGTGSANKQPQGIIPSLEEAHKVTVTTGKLVDILKPLALIDTGNDSVGEIVATMKRTTYYNKFLEYTINVDSNGNVVGKLPNLSKPDLLGLKVVFNNNMDEGQVLFGDYEKYTLVERESITIDKSEHVKFSEDQMAFRGKGRFDGKPTNKNAFVLVTIQEPAGE